ncbi:general secretion pathway protein GspB [Dokdonella soli]|uniref:Type II secretion system protein GspB C-terminal domain-containing protein n=1 Tax=Dokdonella soli TaxID=529810 RepID=A0ABP3TKN2_9GAMM
MSLILEALKKSEQQRRLGEAPTLASPVIAARRGRSVLPLLGALIAAALGVGWWLTRPPAPSPPGEQATHAGSVARSADAPIAKPSTPAALNPAAQPANRMASGHDTPVRHAPIAARPATGTPDAVVNDRSVLPVQPAPPGSDRPGAVLPLPPAPPMVAGPNTPPTTTLSAQPMPEKPASAALAQPSANPVVAPAVATATKPDRIAAPSAVAPTPAPAPPPAAAQAKPQQPALPSVWELPYATRKDLPDLALTMHVYAADPHERFVVIKGNRHVEGDDLGDGVLLREIRVDGIVLDFKGQRFVYPRDGR